MRVLYRVVAAAWAALLLSACGTLSHIGYRDGALVISMDQAVSELHAVETAKRIDSYKSLFVYQHILRLKEGNFVVYEDAKTDIQYEFEPTMMRTIDVVFETRKKVLVYAHAHLHAYQLFLPNGKILNLIAQQSESQELQLLYGMSSAQMDRLLHSLDPHAPATPYRDVLVIRDPHHALQTHWDVQKVHFYPLVVPLPRLLGF
jgi:hypothetical protein